MKSMIASACALTLLGCGAAQAQTTVYWPAPARTDAPGKRYEFPMGTPISLVTRTQINTKDNEAGDRIYFEVAESLTFRGQIVVPVGSVAVGEVTRSERNGHFGDKGKLEIRLLYVQTPYGPVRLTGRAYDEGKSGAVWSFGTMLLASPLGFLIHGTSGYIEPGTPVQGYFADPMTFTYNPPAHAETAVAVVQPDSARTLPASFDPSVFGGAGPQPGFEE